MKKDKNFIPIYFFLADITTKGGIERITINLSNSFVEKDFTVTIVSNFKTNEIPAYTLSPKVNTIYLSEQKYAAEIGSVNRLSQFLKNLKLIKKYFLSIHNSIIILQTFPISFLYWLTMGNRNSNKVLNVEHVQYYYYGRIMRALRYVVYKKYNNTIVLTNEDKKCYEKLKIKVSLIPNGIELNQTEEKCNRKNIICSLGRLDPQKRFDSLIRAFYKISDKYKDWIVEIYGKGSVRDELEKLITELNLNNRVFLKGVTNDVNSVLQQSSIFVVSSEYEGFSIALIEAMSNGIACISYDCPTGPGEILTNDYDGILVENQNEPEMAIAMEELINNPTKRNTLGKNAKESVKKYDIKQVSNQWEVLLEKL